ncbi:MAG TPA: hypothetical protein VN804_00745 [Solirubrobacteraceae bacterium]|nr:hypothetical protein [Solirubrobacteraceae bacterium]
MRLIAALIAVLAATSLAACGSSSGPTPLQVGERWYRAEARGDGSEMCKLSTPARQEAFVDLGRRLPGGSSVSSCSAAVDLALKHYGGNARLGKFAGVHVRLISQSANTAEVQAPKAVALKLVRSGSTWLVAGTAAPAEPKQQG